MNVNTKSSSVDFVQGYKNKYSYFKGGYLQRVFLITGPKTQACIIFGDCARMMLANLW